jgi:hypothetical protein
MEKKRNEEDEEDEEKENKGTVKQSGTNKVIKIKINISYFLSFLPVFLCRDDQLAFFAHFRVLQYNQSTLCIGGNPVSGHHMETDLCFCV